MDSATQQPQSTKLTEPIINNLTDHLAGIDLSPSPSPSPSPLTGYDRRSCVLSGKNMRDADLGICLNANANRFAGKNHASKLPEIAVLDNFVVSRIEFNNGIQAVDSGVRSYILQSPIDKLTATNWLPLYLNMKCEHWARTAGPNGTKKQALTMKKNQGKRQPENFYFLLDHSGSMQGSYINQCIKSIKSVIDESTQDQDMISLATFNSEYMLKFPILNKKDNFTRIMKEIDQCNNPTGSTSFYKALLRTYRDLDTSRKTTVIALSDGDDNSPERKREHQELKSHLIQLNTQPNKKIKFICITVGTLSNESMIKELTSAIKDGILLKADTNAKGIEKAYDQAKKLISSSSGGGETDIVGTQDLVMSSLSLIVAGENGHFTPDDIWRISARILNMCVVTFSKGNKAVNLDTIRDYCDIHRTLIEMFRDYPNVKTKLSESIDKFLDATTPNNRRRELVPDLGEFLQLLGLVDNVTWQQFGKIYIQETFRRNARFLTYLNDKKEAELSVDDKLKFYWPQQRVSMLLMTFNVLFVTEVVHRNGRSLNDLCAFYEENMSYLTPNEMLEFVGKYNFVRDLDSYTGVMKFIGFSDDPKDILEMIYYGKTFEAEPQAPDSGNLLMPSNNIRNKDVTVSNSTSMASSGVDFQNYQPQKPIVLKKGRVIHCGWTVNTNSMDASNVEKLRNMCGSNLMKSVYYTAVVFNEPQIEKDAKAVEIEGKTVTGIIEGYYANSMGTVVDIVIDTKTYQMVLTEPSGTKPHVLKELAKSGKMGSRINIIPMKVDCFGTVNHK